MKPETQKDKKPADVECPNPAGTPYNLNDFLGLLKDPSFASAFLQLLKDAENNVKGAIDCVNSYLAPTTEELASLGIPPSQIDRFTRCTDSGLLVMVTAQQNSQ